MHSEREDMASSSQAQEDHKELIEVMIPANENVNNVSLSCKSLIGKVWTTKSLNKAAIRDSVSKAWSNYPELHISDQGRNLFLFSIGSEAHTKEVMLKKPWYVMNYLLCLQFGY